MNGFDLRRREGLTYFVCPALEAEGFINAFSTRLDEDGDEEFALGHSNASMAEVVARNRRRFLKAVGGDRLVTARQIHSSIVRSSAEPDFTSGLECDAITSSDPGYLIGIQTADCLPLLIGDRQTGAFAGVHAGWRGTLRNIAAETVVRMQSEWGSRPQDLVVALGPAISAPRFQLGPEVLDQFKAEYDWCGELISGEDSQGRAYFDLNECNRRQLMAAGVGSVNIFDSGLCTIENNELFFSYRLEKGNIHEIGRLMSVIGRKKKSE